MNICLCKMTKQLARLYFREFANDPDVFLDSQNFHTYIYHEADVDAYWMRQQNLGRIHLAVLLGDRPIGEVILKNIDQKNRCCTLSIHMLNDTVKNRGYGTNAEILALEYAFCELEMETVVADALRKNERSRHVLEKVGFKLISSDDVYCYYRCEKSTWVITGNMR